MKIRLSTRYVVLLLLVIYGLIGLGVLAIRQEQINTSYQETVHAVYLTNTAVFFAFWDCGQICSATGYTVGCAGALNLAEKYGLRRYSQQIPDHLLGQVRRQTRQCFNGQPRQ